MPEPRFHLAIPIPVRLERADGEVSTEYALNLSPGGMCLQLRDTLGETEVVRLHFAVPALGVEIETRARVVWTQPAKPDAHGELHTETGLSFLDLDAELRERIYAHASHPSEQGR